MKEDKKIVLFDGVCNLCSFWVDFLMKKDKNKNLFFTSLQSDFGQKVLKENNLPNQEFDSFLFLENDVLHLKSTAGIKVFVSLGNAWVLLKLFLLIPTQIRDFVYSFIAKNRYRFFGKKDSCRLPSEEEKERFIA